MQSKNHPLLTFRAGVRRALNRVLRPLNVQINTLTAERAEENRVLALAEVGYFDEPVFPVLQSFRNSETSSLPADTHRFGGQLKHLITPEGNQVGFSLENGWFGSPDAEIAYTVCRRYRPRCIVEVGCGNSSKLFRQAILDGGLDTRLICVDPNPRNDVQKMADDLWLRPIESVPPADLASLLAPGDVLFIDSSHKVATRNDVVFLLLDVLPRLAAGTLVHLHDIFLPFDYPRDLLLDERWHWTEQYLVQALLASGEGYEVLWAGHYIQRLCPEIHKRLLLHTPNRRASSLWLRKTIA